MNKNRISASVIVIAVVALGIATSSFASAPTAGNAPDDFALRHPAGLIAPAANLSSYYRGQDYAERRAAAQLAGYNQGSDFGQRRLAAQLAGFNAGSDFAQRHPDFTGWVTGTDTSDYFLRHPELVTSTVDTSDYFLRHLEPIVR